ncbi:hypothetical protein HQ865_01315 [Mucilaginibacter mali]|uniref:Uncharacterized protein n=1 Tax=Mucilaginibacter mali TaxID=2740462 RepID=A0A7D4TLQ2_9SPHI|nr:hypothetical protein [Mucilaginibacter mali]QKJ28454.1 hypothetical protein HQ865_01315 [Mucilaginibacter mali]
MPETTTTINNRDRFLAGCKFSTAPLKHVKAFEYREVFEVAYIAFEGRMYCIVEAISNEGIHVSSQVFNAQFSTSLLFSDMIF